MNKKILIIAGETSGDIHGAHLVHVLKKKSPKAEIFGIGGDQMKAEGMKLIYHVHELSFMGFLEVAKHLPFIRTVEMVLKQIVLLKKPDVVVLIDYPGFNLRFARTAKDLGCPVVYYISPQVWAWNKRRMKKMKGIIDQMCVVFPFEQPLYEAEGIPCTFVGHPLLEEFNVQLKKKEFCRKNHLDPGKKILAVLPGSRRQELHQMFSAMIRGAGELQKKYDLQIVVGRAPGLPEELYTEEGGTDIDVRFVSGQTHELMKHADVAIVVSGTATLETACFATPLVVVYRTSAITYLIGRIVVRLPYISLVNIVAGKRIVPELIQGKMTVQSIVSEVSRILDDKEYSDTMVGALSQVKGKLGTKGASTRVADAVLALA
jgi:lipid-A-disaccharide synthase